MWAQFQNTSFGLDLVAGSVLVDIMKAQNDPRLADYFAKNAQGAYGGFDVTTGNTAARRDLADRWLGSHKRSDVPAADHHVDETQLIIAEAAFQTRRQGDGHDVRSTRFALATGKAAIAGRDARTTS